MALSQKFRLTPAYDEFSWFWLGPDCKLHYKKRFCFNKDCECVILREIDFLLKIC